MIENIKNIINQMETWELVILSSFSLLILWVILYFLRKLMIRHFNYLRSLDFVFLEVSIPKKDSKDDIEKERDQTGEVRRVIGIGEHFISSLYGIYSTRWRKFFTGQDFISFEFIAINNSIKFIVGCPADTQDLVKKQITSFYKEAVIEEWIPKMFIGDTKQSTGYLVAERGIGYPFKTIQSFETADPMNALLNALSDASIEKNNSAGIQIMIKPVVNNWQQEVRNQAKKLQKGDSGWNWFNPLSWIGDLLRILMHGTGDENGAGKDDENNNPESEEMIKLMQEKSDKVGFQVIIRAVVSANSKVISDAKVQSILDSFAQYGGPNMNGFKINYWHSSTLLLKNYILRTFRRNWHPQHKIIMTPGELAALFHFPHIKYNNIPALKWQNYKIVPPPQNVPTSGLLLGHNVYRGESKPIYMKRDDRFRHFYVIGQTGTGKSSIFQTMARQDFKNGDGLCVIDPHGSLIEDLLPFIPKERIDDVIVFDPSDLERPMGLNLLEANTDEERDMVALDAMNIMIKMFDEDVFGPRIQDYFRNGCLTLMADPDGGSLTDIVRLFTDDNFQKNKLKHVTNPIVRGFWEKQMAQTGEREKQEMIPYFSAKFGAFVTNSMIRNIIGQTKSSFDFAKIMKEGKILLMNLSKGATGDLNSKLLGMIIVSKIQMATLRRQKTMKEDRRDFFLYIDEFQNYVTDSIESILSEARKYRLGLCIAHQYISQIDTSSQKKGVNLKDAVFGNVGTIMSYKIGAQDAEHMSKEMSPVFSENDLINIDKYKAVMKLSIDTQPSQPFSIIPLNPYLEKGDEKMAKALKQISRWTYGRDRKFVEKEIFSRLDV